MNFLEISGMKNGFGAGARTEAFAYFFETVSRSYGVLW